MRIKASENRDGNDFIKYFREEKKMKKFSAKKYFMYALPLAVLYRVIAFFTIDKLIPGIYGRLINFGIIVVILLGCLYLSREDKQE